ncbi:hypothetical protein Rhe02_20320 [Rhizocola hellebori]|uniref:DUF3800 domain-containing protein n=1 Tax=Rhizocola hellebori TaxID=1392758 RepID=A0A8J3Q6B9_9ACTN|nr:hypothetical protein [Rhizocola hellebori]GIH03965.1 hypothetical protein Rhe02_20320 [Rhizocola hellebori]
MKNTQTSIEHALEIACDESGWEGSNLAAANSDVIAHASIRLDIDAAAEWIRALRHRSGHDSYEYKASHLLRARGGPRLAEFLGPSGPVHGQARVHLTHKFCFILGRVLDLFLGGFADTASLGLRPDPSLADAAARLCRAGPGTFGPEPWQAFLAATNVVLRADRGWKVRPPVDAFFGQVEVLRTSNADSPVGQVLDDLRELRRRDAYSARERLLEGHVLQPVLEPLLPALAGTVLHWSRGLHPVAVVHDEQSALTERRMRLLEQILAAPPLELIQLPAHGHFLHFRQTDSRTDPRVQVADLLAGVARKIASDELAGRSDPQLTALLRPYLDPASRWCAELTDPSLRAAG